MPWGQGQYILRGKLILYLNLPWWGLFGGKDGVAIGKIGVDNVADLRS